MGQSLAQGRWTDGLGTVDPSQGRQEFSWWRTAIATAVPLAYLTLAGRKRAMARIGQTRSGLIEDALVVAASTAIVALSTRNQPGE